MLSKNIQIVDRLKKEIEEYVADWHWDNESKKYAFDLGKFLFSFIEYIDDSNLSERVKRVHKDNVYLIGMFEAGYGYSDEFHYEDLTDGPFYVCEFESKISDSKYAVQSYESTWKKLDRFIKSGIYEKYVNKIEKELKNNKNGGQSNSPPCQQVLTGRGFHTTAGTRATLHPFGQNVHRTF